MDNIDPQIWITFLNKIYIGSSGDKYTTLVNAKPKFEVSNDGGDKYTITRITPVNQIAFTFNLGEAVTADPLGAGQPAQVPTIYN